MRTWLCERIDSGPLNLYGVAREDMKLASHGLLCTAGHRSSLRPPTAGTAPTLHAQLPPCWQLSWRGPARLARNLWARKGSA